MTPLEETNSLRLPRWGYGKFEGFWPKKARKIPRGKFTFSWGFFLGFPGCEASGLAASPPGQKHNGVKIGFFVHPRNSGNLA